MSATQVKDLVFTANDQETIKTTVDAAVASLSVEGINGWRLPTTEELDYLHQNCNDINNTLYNLQFDRYSDNSTSYYYIYLGDNSISSYRASGSSELQKYSTNFTGSTIVRAFTTLTFNNQ